jgi:spermidine synthase
MMKQPFVRWRNWCCSGLRLPGVPRFQIRRGGAAGLVLSWALMFPEPLAARQVIFETYSPYHHVLVIDDNNLRILSFDNTQETRMSLANPIQGHFEYTEFFHYAWLWKTNLAEVLMLGLGGGSAQRAFLHYYPRMEVQSVELDPVVLQVATNYFGVPLSERHRVVLSDGRTFLRRSRQLYDLIVLDAYTKHRYGSQIPQHLATREFFELARQRLTTNGVLAYNVITVSRLGGADAGMALARTLQAVFPQVYCFQAKTSLNVVMIATQEPRRLSNAELFQRGSQLIRQGLTPPPGLFERLRSFQTEVPRNAARAPLLTDDFAPVESLGRPRRQP